MQRHPRTAATAAAVAIAVGAGIVWFRHDDRLPTTAPTAPAAPEFVASGWGDPRLGASASGGGNTDPALSPLPEILRRPAVPGDAVDRVQQRQGMNRLFSDARDIERARAKDTLMTPASPAEASGHLPFLSERQKSDGRGLIQYDIRTLESRVEGDQFDIYLPATGVTAKATVEQVESVDGMLRWSGRILDFQEGGRFSVTHALQDDYAVGTFDTPLGNFAMEVKGGWGWVATQASDFSLPPNGNDGLIDASHASGASPLRGSAAPENR
ncbi:MAG: metalloprotease secretion chaperone CpaB [Janthinobacterium lividum]